MKELTFEELKKRYNSWTPLRFADREENVRLVMCRCDCGKEQLLRMDHLRSGHTKKCNACARRMVVIGEKHDKLTIVESLGVDHRHDQIVRCECECGREWCGPMYSVRRGAVTSCGCVVSVSNEKIAAWLKEHGYSFSREYRDSRCRRKLPLPFDFGICINGEMHLVEFQGAHHYHVLKRGGVEAYEKFQESDAIKKTFCEQEGIPLLIIPCWESETMFDTLSVFLGTNHDEELEWNIETKEEEATGEDPNRMCSILPWQPG